MGISSLEPHFCRPMQMSEAGWDTGTCATTLPFTDKGKLSTTDTVHYPPRVDLGPHTPSVDSPDIDMYPSLNPFDAVSAATPEGDMPATLVWTTPQTVPDGNYVLFVEVSKELDDNDTYNATSYPAPSGISFSSYGEPYRGQPSVVYRRADRDRTVTDARRTTTSAGYIGYGDPDGLDGNIRPPDDTISTTVPGSGASRLALATGGYRVQVTSHVQFDSVAPGAITELAVDAEGNQAKVSVTAPGDDGDTGQVQGYDIRLSAGTPIDATNFDSFTHIPSPSDPVTAGDAEQVSLPNLLPDTDYFVGIQAIDDCRNVGPLATISFHTNGAPGSVDACFVATAAYGSILASEVAPLRRFRDDVLRKSVLGELFVESYYTFGPPVAQLTGASELLRATARDVLAPIVARVRALY